MVGFLNLGVPIVGLRRSPPTLANYHIEFGRPCILGDAGSLRACPQLPPNIGAIV